MAGIRLRKIRVKKTSNLCSEDIYFYSLYGKRYLVTLKDLNEIYSHYINTYVLKLRGKQFKGTPIDQVRRTYDYTKYPKESKFEAVFIRNNSDFSQFMNNKFIVKHPDGYFVADADCFGEIIPDSETQRRRGSS